MSLNPYEAIGAAGLAPHPIPAQFLTVAADAARRLLRARAAFAAAAFFRFLALLLFAQLHAAQTFVGATIPVTLALGVESLAGSGGLIGARAIENAAEQTDGERGQHLAARRAAQPARQGIEAVGIHHALLWIVRDQNCRCVGINGWRCPLSYPIRATRAAAGCRHTGCRQAPANLASTPHRHPPQPR